MKSLRRSLTLACVSIALVAAFAGAAAAADELTIARDVNDRGYYLDPGVSISSEEASRLVEHASFQGEFVYLVVLNDNPDGGPTLLAEDVSVRVGEGLVVVLTPEEVGYSGDTTYGDLEVEDALDFAGESGGDDAEYLTAFIEQLTGVPVGEPVGSGVTTTATPETTAAPSSDGGGGGFLWFLIIVGGIGLFAWWMIRRSKAKAAAQAQAQPADRIVQARAVVQQQLDDVANDILDLSEEVQVADNPQADEYYQAAAATYDTATDQFETANDAQSIIDLSQRLDEAIWQLDAAEAILDGHPIPPKPIKERVVIEPEVEPGVPEPPAQRPSYPSYERRPGRRSSYSGPGLFDILMGVGSVLASTRRSGGGGMFGRSGGGMFGRRSTPPPPPTGRSGDGMFGGPMGRVDTGGSSRSSSSSSKRSSSRSSRPRSRIRGGRKRRR